MDDATMIELLRRSPEKGLQAAIEQYGGKVKAVAIRILGNRCAADVEDCMAETFARLWRHWEKFDPEKGSLGGYTCMIARNAAIDMLRRRPEWESSFSEEDMLDFEPDMENQLAAEENRRIVRQTVDELPEPNRTIFIRRYFWCESVDCIAQATGIAYKAVENKLYRGRKQLRGTLLERGVVL